MVCMPDPKYIKWFDKDGNELNYKDYKLMICTGDAIEPLGAKNNDLLFIKPITFYEYLNDYNKPNIFVFYREPTKDNQAIYNIGLTFRHFESIKEALKEYPKFELFYLDKKFDDKIFEESLKTINDPKMSVMIKLNNDNNWIAMGVYASDIFGICKEAYTI